MTASGSPFESPRACPFVALELDRDRRSDKPDYRHRCFAEPSPAPRSIAHQDAYCLSPNFAACPIFQDWATRAAARPVATPKSATLSGPAAAAGAAAGLAGEAAPSDDDLAEDARPEPVAASGAEDEGAPPEAAPPQAAPPGPDLEPEIPMAAAAAAGAASDQSPFTWDAEPESEQLGAFDGGPALSNDEPYSAWGQPDAGQPEPPAEPAVPSDYIAPPAERDDPSRLYAEDEQEQFGRADEAAEAAVPAFLAGRGSRPPMSSTSSLPPPSERVERDDIVPSWEIDGRYGAEAPSDPGGGRMDSILTALAVIVIIGLGVAGVLFLPGLLAGGGGSTSKSPNPSFVPSTLLPSAAPSAALETPLVTVAPSTPQPTEAGPTASPEPEASPRLHRIKQGETLARIARKFKITVADILAANPQIQDANHIEVGQVIVIPLPAATPEPSASP
jgi:LysM repeat protein